MITEAFPDVPMPKANGTKSAIEYWGLIGGIDELVEVVCSKISNSVRFWSRSTLLIGSALPVSCQ